MTAGHAQARPLAPGWWLFPAMLGGAALWALTITHFLQGGDMTETFDTQIKRQAEAAKETAELVASAKATVKRACAAARDDDAHAACEALHAALDELDRAGIGVERQQIALYQARRQLEEDLYEIGLLRRVKAEAAK